MKTQQQIIEEIKNSELESCSIDRRDFGRLADFLPVSDWEILGFKLTDSEATPVIKDWTRENILAQLKTDLDFAFEKALDQRGLSAGAMYRVVKMWMYVLEDQLFDDSDDYTYYGLPFLKSVAVKYGLENPIGDDDGSERKYAD